MRHPGQTTMKTHSFTPSWRFRFTNPPTGVFSRKPEKLLETHTDSNTSSGSVKLKLSYHSQYNTINLATRSSLASLHMAERQLLLTMHSSLTLRDLFQ